ncbi:MAG: efflux transporter periplasmic adaptor subunit [Alphaproteobacteria bacterium CG11_big_fil_rev_8_21_14_0_20_39_49]|nr:MAG: efflux transporter periplasmic adaptor subunit [Alphaproteobacteria bacterium CG11_big_fil_rev_8_21_14_0_20_39_49]
MKLLSNLVFIILALGSVATYAAELEYSDYANGLLDKEDSVANISDGIKGQLQPVKYALISSETTASITTISVSDSDTFNKGDTLVEFNCSIERAELKKAQAAKNADDTRVKVNTKLDELSSISQLDYKLAVYKAEESAAEVSIISERVRNCKIKAPYSGVVEEVLRQNYEYVKKGEPVLKILDDSVLEIELLVPSQWVTWLKKDKEFNVDVSELGKSYKAQITTIGAKIDPVSQSIKIKGAISNKDKILKPGMSVTAFFEK